MTDKEISAILYLVVFFSIVGFNIFKFIQRLRKKTAKKNTQKSESAKDGSWYFGYLEGIATDGDRKVLSFKDGKKISIPADHVFGENVKSGEMLRIYYGCNHVVDQIESFN